MRGSAATGFTFEALSSTPERIRLEALDLLRPLLAAGSAFTGLFRALVLLALLPLALPLLVPFFVLSSAETREKLLRSELLGGSGGCVGCPA